MDMEEFRRELLALIERKIAPLEREIREQSELIAKLAETTAALMRARQGGRAEENKAQKLGGAESEGKRIKEEGKPKAEEAKAKAEEAKRKTEEEKARKLEAKRKQEDANKKKQEEERAAKEKAKKETEERKRGTEERKKKEPAVRGKRPPEESKRPPEELKRTLKRTVKKPEEVEPPPLTQDISQEAAPPSDNKDAVVTGESPQVSEESEAVREELAAVPPSDLHLRVPEPSLSVNLDSENLLLSENSPVVAEGEEEAQPSAPDAEDHSAEVAQMDEEIQRLVATHGEGSLQKTPPFQLSLGAKSAMSLLNTLDDTQLYLNSLPGREETMWVFRLFFQLGGRTLPEEKTEAWEVCRQFLVAGKGAGMDKSVQEAVLSFNFSNENIDLVEKLLGGKMDKVNPNLYNQFCTLTGLIMFTVKEGVIFAGLIPDKAAPWRKYQRLVYRRSLFS